MAGSETFVSSSYDELPTMTSAGERTPSDRTLPRPVPGETWGSYRIGAVLGRGGMGEVYEAEHTGSGRRVALKVLHGRLDQADRARFLREGQIAASISHPHTVYIFGSDEIGGMPVITMELLPGGTLKDRVVADGPLPVVDAVAAVLDIIGGLDAAQAAGILHRDIKPSNCFIEHDGTVKVGDFGLSISTLARDVHQPVHVSSSGFEGTPQFAPPEQLRGEPLDVRADIYAVGATCYYLLTGRAPFDAPDLPQLFARVTSDTPVSPRALRADVPSGVAAIVMQCLAKVPTERPSSYAELAGRLRPFGPGAHRPASPGVRLVAGAVDAAILALPNAMLGAWAGAGSALATMLVWTLSFCYYLALEGVGGASLGKRALGLRVVSASGAPAPVARVAVRTATFLVGILLAGAPVAMGLRPAGSTGFSANAAPLIVLTLLFVTIRRRNGWAAVHDLVSGTRVVAMQDATRPVSLRRAPRVEAASPAVGLSHSRLGPFRPVGELPHSGTERLVLAFDPQLRRQVWILVVAPGTPDVAAARRDVARPTRLRWLTGRRTGDEHWDAFEAPAGEPVLERLAEPVAWSVMRPWLSDLASELAAASRDGSLPPLALDRLWVRDDGRIVLLDHPAPGVTPPAPGAADLTPVALLAALVARAWPTEASFGGPAGLPLSARRLVDQLSRSDLPSLDEVRVALVAATSSPERVRRWRRAIPAALGAIPALVLGAAGLVVMPSLARLADVETATMLGWLSELRRPVGEGRVPDAEGREALAIYVAGRYGPVLRDEGFWSGAVMQNMPPALRASARDVLARHPSVEPNELARASAILEPRIREAEAHYRAQQFELRRGATIMVLTLTAFGLCFALAAAILSSLAVPGGMVLRQLGLAVVDGQGAEIGRARSVVRTLAAWSPVIAWLLYLAASPAVQGWVPDPGAPLLSLALMASVMGVGIAWLLTRPSRGLHDHVTGTWVVGR